MMENIINLFNFSSGLLGKRDVAAEIMEFVLKIK